MNSKTRLIMTFKTDLDKKISLSVDEPRADVTETEIKDAMELIVAKNIFKPSKAPLIALVDAKIVTTDTTEYDLV